VLSIKTNKQNQNADCSPFQVDSTERVYAVGDIHGRSDLLTLMLTKISEDMDRFSDHRRNRIIFMGDYIDRGDHSREVIEVLADLHEQRKGLPNNLEVQVDFLIGNHEAAMLSFLEDPERGRSWLNWGGAQTLASFGIAPAGHRPSKNDILRMRDELAEKVSPFNTFFAQLSQLVVSGEVVFVHAGLDPDFPLSRQPEDANLWGRTASGKPLGMPGYRIVHGHFGAIEPVSLPDRICVDTWAFQTGRLTAVRLDDGEAFFWAGV